MKRFILPVILSTVITFPGCYASYNLGDGEVTVISQDLNLNHTEPDKEAAEGLQSAWGNAQENTVPENAEKDRAEEILAEMSLEEKVGQVIMARYPENPAEAMAEYKFGGYTLYAKDFEGETPESLADELAEVKSENPVAPFIAADEEGGVITRVSRYKAFAEERLPSVQEALAEGMSMSDWTEQMASALKKAGVNLNFAPVADVAENESDYIYDRTAGLDYAETGEVIAEIVKGMNCQGIMGCLKHFPGYGSNVDTHTGIAVDERSRESFEEKDFTPFKSGIEAGVPMIMVNHNIVTAYNSEMPASLAPEVHEALRELGFDGIIITDDLGMDAITLYSENPYAAAFLAGNDMLCTSDGAACYNALYSAVQSGEITEEQLDESVLRVLRAKIEYEIIE